MKSFPIPTLLIILDGWGYSEESTANAIAAAHTPNWDSLWASYPHCLISGSGSAVGLPDEQMGNSEVGHLNMGAGRIVYQDFTRIQQSIVNKDFFVNPVLNKAIEGAKNRHTAIHILGLLSPGGVHSHEDHIHALLELAHQKGMDKLYIHAFLDGRDTPPKSAINSLLALENKLTELGIGKMASIIGRYYAMDRDQRWDRIRAAYDMLSIGKASYHYPTAKEALLAAYERGETDEFVKSSCIHAANQPAITIQAGDTVIFMNYRADRARQLTQAFTQSTFNGFSRCQVPKVNQFVTLTQYAMDLDAITAFAPVKLTNVLGEYLSNQGIRQLRIAETEKYAHVTFFFNGGREEPFTGEKRQLIPSPNVATYDLQPEMSAAELTNHLVNAINSKQYEIIICNYANADMVGHTGNMDATIKAIETLDNCLGKVIVALKAVGGQAIITADHGNAEQMLDEKTQQPHTAHTSKPVPFIYVGRPATVVSEQQQAALSDIAPTLLHIMGLSQPQEMTGHSLIKILPDDN